MFEKLVLLLSCLAIVSGGIIPGAIPVHTGVSSQTRSQDDLGNYSFGYDIVDAAGAANGRVEHGDAHGNKVGSYQITDIDGRVRRVDYVADDFGFRATINTNEPGTAPSESGAALYTNAHAHPVAPLAAAPVPVIAPAPVAVHAPAHPPPYIAESFVAPAPAYYAQPDYVPMAKLLSPFVPARALIAAPAKIYPAPAPIIAEHAPVLAPAPVHHAPFYGPAHVPQAHYGPAPVYGHHYPAPAPVAHYSHGTVTNHVSFAPRYAAPLVHPAPIHHAPAPYPAYHHAPAHYAAPAYHGPAHHAFEPIFQAPLLKAKAKA